MEWKRAYLNGQYVKWVLYRPSDKPSFQRFYEGLWYMNSAFAESLAIL